MWDYDEAGTHILIDGQVAGQARKLIAHSARNGFFCALERSKPSMDCQAAKRKARGHTRLQTMKTVLFLIVGKLHFTAINPHAA
jgi:glucose dehydrogenase